MSTVDVNRVIVTGENSAIRLSPTDGDSFTTNASFWRILSSAGGSGHEEPIVNRPEECLRALIEGRVDFVTAADAVWTRA